MTGSPSHQSNPGARVIQVIETELLRRGSGNSDADPVRVIRQYWTLEGELIAEIDPVADFEDFRMKRGRYA